MRSDTTKIKLLFIDVFAVIIHILSLCYVSTAKKTHAKKNTENSSVLAHIADRIARLRQRCKRDGAHSVSLFESTEMMTNVDHLSSQQRLMTLSYDGAIVLKSKVGVSL